MKHKNQHGEALADPRVAFQRQNNDWNTVPVNQHRHQPTLSRTSESTTCSSAHLLSYQAPGIILAFPGGVLGRRYDEKRVAGLGLLLMTAAGIFMGVGG